jgi:hypothetical protein
LPSQTRGRELVKVVANQIADLARTNRKQCHDFLFYYINNVWGTRDWVTFKGFRTMEVIKEWKRFVRQVLKSSSRALCPYSSGSPPNLEDSVSS